MRETLKRLLWEWRGVWITAPTVAGLMILLRWLGLFQSWEWAAFDQYLRLRPLEPPDNRIVIVGVDEADLRAIGKSTLPDSVVAQVIEKLKARHPRAIGLDIYRDFPVEPGHQKLVRVFESTPNLVGIQKVVGDRRREAVAPPPALKAKGQVGANDLIFDADSKVACWRYKPKMGKLSTAWVYIWLCCIWMLKGFLPRLFKGRKIGGWVIQPLSPLKPMTVAM